MRIPAWLDPWWHIDYEVRPRLSVGAAEAALLVRTPRFRGARANDGAVVLTRRGGLVNQFVTARATVLPDGAGSRVRVRIARSAITSGFFAFGFVFVVVGQLIQVILSAVFYPPRLVQSAFFLVVGVLIWVLVIGGNYTSARNEAQDLQGFIRQALGGAG